MDSDRHKFLIELDKLDDKFGDCGFCCKNISDCLCTLPELEDKLHSIDKKMEDIRKACLLESTDETLYNKAFELYNKCKSNKIALLEIMYKDVKYRFNSTEIELDMYRSKLETWVNNTTSEKVKVDKCMDLIFKHEAKIESLKSDVQDLNDENDELLNNNKDLLKDNKALRKELQEFKAKFESVMVLIEPPEKDEHFCAGGGPERSKSPERSFPASRVMSPVADRHRKRFTALSMSPSGLGSFGDPRILSRLEEASDLHDNFVDEMIASMREESGASHKRRRE